MGRTSSLVVLYCGLGHLMTPIPFWTFYYLMGSAFQKGCSQHQHIYGSVRTCTYIRVSVNWASSFGLEKSTKLEEKKQDCVCASTYFCTVVYILAPLGKHEHCLLSSQCQSICPQVSGMLTTIIMASFLLVYMSFVFVPMSFSL